MQYHVYQCLDCKHQMIERNMEGRRCGLCGDGQVTPLRHATTAEVSKHLDEKIATKRVTTMDELIRNGMLSGLTESHARALAELAAKASIAGCSTREKHALMLKAIDLSR